MVGRILHDLFLTDNLFTLYIGLKKMSLFWMICILIDVGLLLTLVCVSLLIAALKAYSHQMSIQCKLRWQTSQTSKN